MKKASSLIVVFVCVGTISLLAESMRIDAKTWHGVQTYGVQTLSKNLKSHTGELVDVKFNFRGKDIHHTKPNWYEGSIWQPGPPGKKGFSDVRVMIAKKDLPAFKSITTVYGRVSWDSESNFTFVRLIGRNTVVDPSGNAVISW